MATDFKKIVQQEYLKCVKDPIHFMRKYCTIQHPTRGKIKFDLYKFQENMLTTFKDNDYKKCRTKKDCKAFTKCKDLP